MVEEVTKIEQKLVVIVTICIKISDTGESVR
jgi:hypothetical protein